MSDKLGPLSFDTPEAGEIALDKPYSEATAQLIDQEVREIISAALARTRQLVAEKKQLVEKVKNPHLL